MKDKAIIAAISIIFVAFVAGCTGLQQQGQVNKFSSMAEMKSFIQANQAQGYGGFYGGSVMMSEQAVGAAAPMAADAAKTASADSSSGPADFSRTNVQVEGVDEPDFVKTDGKYIYDVEQGKLSIVNAYPGESLEIVSATDLNGTASDLFVSGNKLVVFGYKYEYDNSPKPMAGAVSSMDIYPHYSREKVFIKVFDVSDRANPVLKRDILLDGSYYDSRMIGDYVYIILNQPVVLSGDVIPLPLMYSEGKSSPLFDYSDVYYFPYPDYSYRFTDIATLNLQDDSQSIKHEPFMIGDAQNLYVSQDNIYITGVKQMSQSYYMETMIKEVIIPSVPANVAANIIMSQGSNASAYEKMQSIAFAVAKYQLSLNETEKRELEQKIQEKAADVEARIAKERQMTTINKIAISNGNVQFRAHGEVPGSVLNQFSMDESNGYFRIATTVEGTWVRNAETKSENNVYVLDQDMNTIGKLEDLAPGEKIYSARFMGNRAYLVTFKRVDPLFVIDLSNPADPHILGKLKIPGWSDYLHPYDENHIIGIGKDVDESIDADKVHSSDAVYYTAVKGVKMSLFDVTDVSNPVEVAKVTIGDMGTDSEALRDHKAFLFDKSKNLLVLPILLAEQKSQSSNYYGDFTFQGAYVFDLTLDKGFVLRGRITHVQDDSLVKSGYYYSSPYSVKRSMYIGDYLYTVSDSMIKANSLGDLKEIKSVELPYNETVYRGPYYMV
jgi:uncharacterized secreted protein with C-terminal beta-propeller domain